MGIHSISMCYSFLCLICWPSEIVSVKVGKKAKKSASCEERSHLHFKMYLFCGSHPFSSILLDVLDEALKNDKHLYVSSLFIGLVTNVSVRAVESPQRK